MNKIIEYDNGDRYEGEIVDGNFEGKGQYTWVSGSSYCGDWKNGLFHGFGVMKFNSGDMYEGNFVNDHREGFGIYHYNDGAVYEGEWSNNKKNGYGELKFASGDRYVGLFKDDNFHGNGEYYYSNGDVFKGIYIESNRNGYGTYTWQDGAVFEGYYQNDRINGEGRMSYASGSMYEGHFKDDTFHGQGIFKWNDGAMYEGNFENGKRNGFGKYTYCDGSVYEGNWKEDNKHGQGEYREYSNEKRITTITRGVWNDDQIGEHKKVCLDEFNNVVQENLLDEILKELDLSLEDADDLGLTKLFMDDSSIPLFNDIDIKEESQNTNDEISFDFDKSDQFIGNAYANNINLVNEMESYFKSKNITETIETLLKIVPFDKKTVMEYLDRMLIGDWCEMYTFEEFIQKCLNSHFLNVNKEILPNLVGLCFCLYMKDKDESWLHYFTVELDESLELLWFKRIENKNNQTEEYLDLEKKYGKTLDKMLKDGYTMSLKCQLFLPE